jgi:hypothetical protein
MFSNKTDLAETNCFTNNYFAVKTECFLPNSCLPTTGVSPNNLVEIASIAPLPTSQLAGLTGFTEGNIGSEADILVRASWNRCVDHAEKYLWEHLHSHPVSGTLTITVPRKQKQPEREAILSIRHALVVLRPPQRRKGEKLPSVTVFAVLALEEQPAQGIKPLEWLLLTTVPVYHFHDACERIQWYTCRWLIEIYHQVLKSGCRVEQRQFETSERIRRYLAVDSVVAWRVLFLTMLGRELPEMPCDAILAAHQWQALYCFIHQTNIPPRKPPTLAEATRWIAQMGGFLGRKADGHPGVTVIWRGLQRLQDVAQAFQLFQQNTS